MSIPRGRLNLRMPEQFADHRQALAQRQCPRGERVAQVIQPDLIKARPLSDRLPGLVQVHQVGARLVSRDHPGIAGNARQLREDPRGHLPAMALRARPRRAQRREAARPPPLLCLIVL